ncbi:MAG: CoA transferase, partial [Marmoricola sp.]
MTPTSSDESRGPLTGVRVVDLTTTFMGPYCTAQMARMGADVIKVEEPTGDVTRGINDRHRTGLGPIFIAGNHGKRSIALDLKDPRGRDALLALVKQADVLVHNMRPQAVAKL